jgi:outer membrane protein assembly factor BamB
VAWSQDIAGGVGPGSPVVIDSVVLLGTMRGDLYAIHSGTGQTLGWINLGEAIHGSPAVERFVAVVALANTQASLVSYDFYNGSVRWRRAYGDIEMTPLKVENRIYVGNLQGLFFAIETVEGNEIWHFALPDNTRLTGIRSSPALSGTTIVFGTDDGWVYALEAEDGSLIWRVQAGAPVWATPAIANGLVVVGTIDGEVVALELASGRLQWRYQAGSPVHAGALLDGNHAVIGTLGGSLRALEITTGQVVWETDAGGPINAQMVAASRTGYVGTLIREILAVDLDSGEILWRESLSGRVKSSAAVAGTQLFVATDDRVLVALREERP